MKDDIAIRPPVDRDGPNVHRLIADCPPLDRNSMYCNLLQCAHFADSSAIAERADGTVVGFVSGYVVPRRPDTLFIWQVAVRDDMRGRGLAKRLVMDILARPASKDVRRIETTITEDNAASWAAFRSLARSLDCGHHSREFFRKDTHFAGAHASETLLTIGPFVPLKQTVDA